MSSIINNGKCIKTIKTDWLVFSNLLLSLLLHIVSHVINVTEVISIKIVNIEVFVNKINSNDGAKMQI